MDFRAVLHPDTLANSHDESTAFCASADSGFESGAGGQPLEGGCMDGSSAAVAVDRLLAELQSVCVEWKSLRQAKSCSCAMPFEHHAKKVSTLRCLSLSLCACLLAAVKHSCDICNLGSSYLNVAQMTMLFICSVLFLEYDF